MHQVASGSAKARKKALSQVRRRSVRLTSDSALVCWQDRDEVIQHIEKRPEAMWKINTMWSFRNEAKMYGSPMFDAVWAQMTSDCSNRMLEVVQSLRHARVPKQYQKAAVA